MGALIYSQLVGDAGDNVACAVGLWIEGTVLWLRALVGAEC